MGRVWINEGRLVTDGPTPVDGCFNSSPLLYIPRALFVRQKNRTSAAPRLQLHVSSSPPLDFTLVRLYNYAQYLFTCQSSILCSFFFLLL